MTTGEIVRQGFYYARTCRWLWLFGFLVAIASGGSSGGGGAGNANGVSVGVGGVSIGGGLPNFSVLEIALLAIVVSIAVALLTALRFVGEGALIAGIVRARQGGTMTIGEGFRAGWAHWGVLVRIALLYLAATIGSGVLLVTPCVIAMRAFGPPGAVVLGLPSFLVGVPWFVTLYLVQAFAWRIAVLENRQALDAIGKARLFLHGRLVHGLKLIVAAFVGTLAILVPGLALVTPVAVLLVALIPVLRVFPVVVLACVVVVPALSVLAAMAGTFRSSIWTIGYVTQVES